MLQFQINYATLNEYNIVLPCPVPEGEGGQDNQMGSHENQVETSMQEHCLRHKPPVHSPLKQELTAQIECSRNVANWIGHEEWHTQHHLYRTIKRHFTATQLRKNGPHGLSICLTHMDQHELLGRVLEESCS